MDEQTKQRIARAKERAERLLELAQEERDDSLITDVNVASERHVQLQSCISKLGNFLRSCDILLDEETNPTAAKLLWELEQLKKQIKDLEKEYTLWWEKAKLYARQTINGVINYFPWCWNKICNISKQLSNFCTSIVGFGDYFQQVSFKFEQYLQIGDKWEELNRKEAKKSELRTKITTKQAQLENEHVDDIRVLKQNHDSKKVIYENIKIFIQYDMPGILQTLQSQPQL